MAQNKDSQNDITNNKTDKTNGRHPFVLFMLLISNPKVGWKRVKNMHFSHDVYARSLFYPLLALMAACRFMSLVYGSDESIGTLLQQAVAAFVAGFAGYFIVLLLGRWFLPAVASLRIDSEFGKIYVMTNMCALATATIIYELFPSLGLLLLILPIYISYIIAKGIRFLRLPENEETPASVLMVLLILGIPMLIYFAFEVMMPAAA